MPVFAMPVILMIDADSVEDAQKAIDDWCDEIEMDDLPAGTEEIDHSPSCEFNDEGQRLLYLPAEDDASAEDDDEEKDDDTDDFNEAEEDF